MHDNELLQAVSDMLAKQLQPVHTKLSGIDDRLLIIETDVSSLKEDVAVLKADVSGLKSDMVIVKSDVAGLKADMTDVKSDIADLKSDVVSIDSDVTGIKVTFENDINRKLSLLAEGIGDIRDRLHETSATTDINAEDVATLKAAIRIITK